MDDTTLLPDLVGAHDELTAWRHDLHRHPETAFQEHRTSALIAERMRSWGFEVDVGLAGTGVVGTLRGRSAEGPRIGLRADIDALPMAEANTFAHRSTNDGAFHGCGHDGHTTMLLAAARHLAANPDFAGTLHLIFQPAEEGGGGARVMIEQGLFDRFPCDRVFALHNWPGLPFGELAALTGPIMASADEWRIAITGHGGHAAWPHTTVDPIVVGARIVDALQTLVSRETNPLRAGVVSVTKFHAGSAYNVIPGTAELWGTARALDAEVRDALEAGIERVASGIAAAHGATAQTTYTRGYPITVNEAESAELAAGVAEALLGKGRVHRQLDPAMGGEDFAFMLEQVPGAYLWLGQGGSPTGCALHNPHYDFDDRLLPVGGTLWVRLVRALMPL